MPKTSSLFNIKKQCFTCTNIFNYIILLCKRLGIERKGFITANGISVYLSAESFNLNREINLTLNHHYVFKVRSKLKIFSGKCFMFYLLQPTLFFVVIIINSVQFNYLLLASVLCRQYISPGHNSYIDPRVI